MAALLCRSSVFRLALYAAVLVPTGLRGQGPRAALNDTTLANGLDIIVVENHTVPLATVLVAVRTGAFAQLAGEQGLAHLFEHVLFGAYGGGPTDFAQDASALNAGYNGTTGIGVVTYYLVLPSGKVGDAVQLLGRLMTRARFRKRDLEEELPVVLDELARTESDPEEAFQRRVTSQLWGEDWFRRDVLGDSTALASVTVDRVEEAFAEFYIPNNAALIVTGDVDPGQVYRYAADHFGEWEAGVPPFPADGRSADVPDLSGTSVVTSGGSVLDVTIRVAFRGPGLASDATSVYAADVLSTLFNEGDSPFRRALVTEGPFETI